MYHDLNIFSKNISIVVVVNLTSQVLLFNHVRLISAEPIKNDYDLLEECSMKLNKKFVGLMCAFWISELKLNQFAVAQ